MIQDQIQQTSVVLQVAASSPVLVVEALLAAVLVVLAGQAVQLAVTDLEMTATEVVAVAGVLLAAMQLVAVLVVQVAQPLVALVTL